MVAGTVGRRGQITLPRTVRQTLNLREGDKVLFAIRGDEVVLRSVPKTLLDLRGSVSVDEPQDFEEVRRLTQEAHAREVVAGEQA